MRRSLPILLLFAACATPQQVAQRATGPDVTTQIESARSLMQRADIVQAMQFVDADRDRIVQEWTTLTEIPAPSAQEAKRADAVADLIRAIGFTPERDAVGNVIVTRKGTGGGGHVVFDAHLDTVFPMNTNVTVRIENGRMHAPGVGDNTRNVASLLAMLRAMDAAKVTTRGDVTFTFTVEEETNYRGIRQLLADRAATIDSFVALDGGFGTFTYGGIGIYWDRYHFLGPGGHTRSRTPPYSATLALARALDELYKLPIPNNAWLNVGMLGAGDVFNAKAEDAWMSVDLRSEDAATLTSLDSRVEAIVHSNAARLGMTARREVVSKSEVAKLPGHRTSPMVLTSEGVYRAFGFDPEPSESASNHSSVAILAGLPAISTGAAPCRGSHAVTENCEIDPILTGIKRQIVLAVALSDLPPRAPREK